ncbi:MAG: 2-hydroxyacyl-CoA dehydratase family protein [Anaerolineales bacterium]
MKTNLNIPGRMDAIREYQNGGGSVGAVFPIHYPRALLRAFNVLPVEVWGPPRVKTRYGAAHLQPYICSIVHNALSFLQAGGLEVADLLLVPHACDSLQGLGSILIDFASPRQPVLPLYLPRGRRPGDVDFLADELRSLYSRLEGITGRAPTRGKLMECVLREEAADQLLAELHQRRQELALTDVCLYRVLRSREYLPAERFIPLAQDAFQGVGENGRGKKAIILSGIVPEPMSLFGAISELGGVVVADDLACCGRRLYPLGRNQEPFQRMAERLVHAPPDPTRGSPIPERLDHLLHLAEASKAQGVVFYEVKFCEPELFDIPSLRSGLQEAGLPSLVIEVDINDPLSQRVFTRLEAFLEMIS